MAKRTVNGISRATWVAAWRMSGLTHVQACATIATSQEDMSTWNAFAVAAWLRKNKVYL